MTGETGETGETGGIRWLDGQDRSGDRWCQVVRTGVTRETVSVRSVRSGQAAQVVR